MDERLQKALDFSNYMVTLNNQKRVLQEKFYQDIIFYFKGGQFTVDKTLLSFCQTLLQNHQTTAVLVDDNDIPVEVKDLEKFQEDILDVYFTASNEFLTEYNKLKTNRSVEKLVEL